MASTRSSPAVSSITQQSDSTNSSSTTNSVTSSASGGWNIAYALAAVPATIAESDLSQTLDYSKMTDGLAAMIATDSSGQRSSGEEQQSDDEEMIIKEQLEIIVAKKAAAEMKAQELELRFKLKQKLRSNASQSSRGSNDRSRTRLYGPPETATTELFDVFTPLQASLEMSNASTPVLPVAREERCLLGDLTVVGETNGHPGDLAVVGETNGNSNVDPSIQETRAPGSSSDRRPSEIPLPVSTGGSSAASVIDESLFTWDKVKRKRRKRNRGSTIDDDIIGDVDRNAMMEHVLAETAFEV